MKKILAYTKDSVLHGDSHLLQCCLCGENDRNKLKVEDIGIAVGMSGENYSFCSTCWNSNTLGKKILKMLNYENGLRYKDETLDIKEVDK